ncbi:MAG: PHB depolymerase family esterase [Candidatus Sungbacteria bacterium]|nr:PHB depolymerase family esterase [bacterium]MDZ4260686.1 PHB depolymerase family esterase [Candidatus Sungbacteria bacterium]
MKINKYHLLLTVVVLFVSAHALVVQSETLSLRDRLRQAIEERRASGQSMLKNTVQGKAFFRSVFSLQKDVLGKMRARIASRERLPVDIKGELLTLVDARIVEVEGQAKVLETIASGETLKSFIQGLKTSRDSFRFEMRAVISSHLSSKGLTSVDALEKREALLLQKLAELKSRGVNVSRIEERMAGAHNFLERAKKLLQGELSADNESTVNQNEAGAVSLAQGFRSPQAPTLQAAAVFKETVDTLQQATGEYKGALVSINEEVAKQAAALPASTFIPASVTLSTATILAGGTITVSWNNVRKPMVSDWIGVYAPGAADTDYSAVNKWFYTSSCGVAAGTTAKASGSCTMTMPTIVGTYELRLFANDGYTKLATSLPIVVMCSTNPGDYCQSITVDGRIRTYLLHLPSGYQKEKSYPLVLHFHGGGGTGQQAATKTGFNAYADKDGFIAVYPDGIANSWNDGRGTTEADKQGINDVGFVSALIDNLVVTYSIDKNRIFASGMSNGAIFSHRLGCELSSKIVAIGPVAGEIPEAIAPSCNLSSPMSRVAIHGVDDPLNPFLGGETRGGEGGRILSAQATAEKWAKHNGCSLTPVKTKLLSAVNDGTSVEQWNYPNCWNGTEVILYAVYGMGHAWPPQPPEIPIGVGKTSQNIDATKITWEFFKAHRRLFSTLVLSPSSPILGVNGNGQFSAAYDPDGLEPALQQYPLLEEITWVSSNPSIVSVDVHGVLTAKVKGSAIITATYKGLSAQAQVKVSGRVESYSFETPDKRTRSYLLYIPSQYSTQNPTALILAFHGGGGNGQSMMDGSLMNVTSDKEGFLVAYPDGTGTLPKVKTWNVGPCCGYAQENKVNDVTFVSMLIDDVGKRSLDGKPIAIDTRRVYATGISNGGMMSHRLGCELAGKIAAVAPIGGGLNFGGDFTSCVPSRKISVLNFHGTTDDNYLYYCDKPEGCRGPDAGSQNELRVSIPSVVHDWIVRNNIPESSKQITYQKGIETCEMYSSSNKKAEVGLCTANPLQKIKEGTIVYDGGGHIIPGGIRNPGSTDADVPTQDISANAAMWEFFKKHPLEIEVIMQSKPTLTTSVTGSGSITGTGINCGADCTEKYASGASITLTATPSTGYTFSGWSGVCTGTKTTCTITMDTDKSAGANFVLPPVKKIFISSAVYTGNLGGLSGADAKCQLLAKNAGLTGTFKAWLSDSVTAAKNRVTHATITYKLANGITIANNWNDLTDGTLLTSLNITEQGTAVNANVWTNTKSDGTIRETSKIKTCGDWTATTGLNYIGYFGESKQTNIKWTDSGSQTWCTANSMRLYCIEQ